MILPTTHPRRQEEVYRLWKTPHEPGHFLRPQIFLKQLHQATGITFPLPTFLCLCQGQRAHPVSAGSLPAVSTTLGDTQKVQELAEALKEVTRRSEELKPLAQVSSSHPLSQAIGRAPLRWVADNKPQPRSQVPQSQGLQDFCLLVPKGPTGAMPREGRCPPHSP